MQIPHIPKHATTTTIATIKIILVIYYFCIWHFYKHDTYYLQSYSHFVKRPFNLFG